jgi:hypothetical protein
MNTIPLTESEKDYLTEKLHNVLNILKERLKVPMGLFKDPMILDDSELSVAYPAVYRIDTWEDVKVLGIKLFQKRGECLVIVEPSIRDGSINYAVSDKYPFLDRLLQEELAGVKVKMRGVGIKRIV